MFARAQELLDPRKTFGQPPVNFGRHLVTPPNKEQMILRMLVKRPETEYLIPECLGWLKPTIFKCEAFQQAANITTKFVYITVRHGIVSSVTDDLWHVDGFSTRVPHSPEQNYIWTDSIPTEILNQPVNLPSDFNPLRHNIHTYFQDVASLKNMVSVQEKTLYGIDPYVIHRRPQIPENTKRTFFRVSFVPIEIEDDNCTQNPLLLVGPYNRTDIRLSLERYSVAKSI